jgi:hypothetical protein
MRNPAYAISLELRAELAALCWLALVSGGTGGWPIDELMREREAVADLHQVLIEALRAMLGLCGIDGTVDGKSTPCVRRWLHDSRS